MKFKGLVSKVTRTSDGHPYAVIEIENTLNLNYRLFIPGADFQVRQHVTIHIETEKERFNAQKQMKKVTEEKHEN